MSNGPKAVVIYSGGMDSFTLVNQIHRNLFDPKKGGGPDSKMYALSFDYGQRHKKELLCAQSVCAELGIEHQIVDLTSLTPLISASALTGSIDVPEGHYAAENMKLTVVPNRNMIMLSIAVGYAVNVGADKVYFGAHAGDHDIYPDCRQEFVDKLSQVTEIANYQPVKISAPYISFTKTDILKFGLGLGLDYLKSWTCYKGGVQACGRCGSCQERLGAFQENGCKDPLEYDSRVIVPLVK